MVTTNLFMMLSKKSHENHLKIIKLKIEGKYPENHKKGKTLGTRRLDTD
jgi:hypothetical protein